MIPVVGIFNDFQHVGKVMDDYNLFLASFNPRLFLGHENDFCPAGCLKPTQTPSTEKNNSKFSKLFWKSIGQK
jgi:hypothetical protein